MITRKLAVAGATAALVGGVSACGGSSSTPSASSIVPKVKQNATSAKSAAMAVSGSVQGETVTLNVAGTLDGKNQQQTQKAAGLQSQEYVVGNTAYLKANDTFLTANGMTSDQSKTMANKWWSKSLSGDSGTAIDVKGLLNTFFNSADGKKLSSSGATIKKTDTRGQATYTISDPKNAQGAKLVVTAGASPQLVEIQNYASDLTQNTKATYAFSRWNAVSTFKAPSGAKSINDAPSSKSSSSSSSTPSSPSSPSSASSSK